MDANEAYYETLEKTKQVVRDVYLPFLAQQQGGNWWAEECPKYADVDYKIYFGEKIHHFLEVKCRKHDFGYYRKEKMPIRKHAVAKMIMDYFKVKTVYLVCWSDRIAYLILNNRPDEFCKMVARADRGTDEDYYCLYDIGRFTVIDR